jgi:hypothetical protein
VIQKALPETAIDEEKEEWKEDDVKARKIIIYSVRDHFLPRIVNLKTARKMYEALKNMFENNNTLRALTLKGQLQNIKMTKGDTVAIFFMKMSEVRDWLAAIGEIISDRELVLTTLNDLPRHWEPFLQSISGRAELPTFDRLWTDCTQEEIRLIARGVEDSPHDDNHAFAFKGEKKGGRNKRNSNQAFKGEKTSSTSGYDHRKDKSKIQCFRCDQYGHFARNCPTRKRGRQYASTVDTDPDPPRRDEDMRDEGVCNGCAQGKNIKNHFPKRHRKAKGVLELIQLDVCGPMPSSSISGYVYYVSFIDDYSHKTWVYLLKSEDEVFSKFKEFKALIENLYERKIKILRSDNGGEYTSKEFVNYCKDVGIKRELTTTYNPQQNGVAERKNRTIMEAVKTMIHDQDLPMCLWAEAAKTIVYVQN